ncbi:Sensor histidine kinase [Burkholderiales bacterium 8X]|nr:Sensor histidine kinase [Burkholderiales bacterium 8X]
MTIATAHGPLTADLSPEPLTRAAGWLGRFRSTASAAVQAAIKARPVTIDGATRHPNNQASNDEALQRSVDIGLLEIFVRGTRFRQRVGGTLMGVFVVFCWGHVSSILLLAWLAAGLGVLMLRHRFERNYERPGAFDDAEVRAAFVHRMLPIYTVHGGLWGLSLIFSFDRIPLYDQMGCWLVLACVASAPLTSVALVPKLLKAYTNTLFVLLVTILISRTLVIDSAQAPHILLLALPLFYWWLLGRFGKGILQNQREQFGLQFDIARKEQEARAAVQAKERFLCSAAHDLRQPVMALSLYAEHLVEFPEMHLELAPKIAAASQSVKSLFESLFDLANLASGQVRLNVEEVEVGAMLRGLALQFEPLAAAKNLRLHVHAGGGRIRSDRVRLQRMVGNVLGNAIKYSPPGKKILLSARHRGTSVEIDVWDQGFGIPEDDLDKVFEEFYRVDRPDTASIDGVGLGLSIVSRLSRLLNTRIRITSAVGCGTRFSMSVSDLAESGPARCGSIDVG